MADAMQAGQTTSIQCFVTLTRRKTEIDLYNLKYVTPFQMPITAAEGERV
jgi:hypothetical protein